MENKRKKGLDITLRWGLGSAFVGLSLLTLFLFGLVTHLMVHTSAKEEFRNCLFEATGIAALVVDARLHSSIHGPTDESSEAYLAIQRQLRRVRNVSGEIQSIHTLRKEPSGRIIFAVDATQGADRTNHVGHPREKVTPAMLAAFEKPYRVTVEQEFHTDKAGTTLSSYAPIFNTDGSLEAVLAIVINAQKIAGYESDYIYTLCTIIFVSTLVAMVLGFLFSRRISKPLLALEQDMARIQRFDLDHKPEVDSRVREIVMMKSTVDNMKNSLRSFKKYVPADLVAELILLRKEAVLGAEKREMTIFFSDIAGFTTISEQVSPEVLSERLGVYFEGMTSTILRQRGTVDKFIGDAIMAFWGAPGLLATHAEAGCRAALACQRLLAEQAPAWSQAGFPAFPTRMGLCSGEVIVGNMGYKDRLSYTVIGDTVNLASRLESLNKYYGTRIVIGESTQAQVDASMVTRFLDVVAVKGKSQGVRIYELVEERDRVTPEELQFVNRYNDGMRLYLDRQWQRAAGLFSACLEERPQDRPADMLLVRCREYEVQSPPTDWRGVTIMKEK
ncbi:MAG: hypothetical protein HQL66_00835 [Magnetococcales bacterium]|nr:hypothetical protein [Magnetococcales bacterium]